MMFLVIFVVFGKGDFEVGVVLLDCFLVQDDFSIGYCVQVLQICVCVWGGIGLYLEGVVDVDEFCCLFVEFGVICVFGEVYFFVGVFWEDGDDLEKVVFWY